jgi:hypothetical protein
MLARSTIACARTGKGAPPDRRAAWLRGINRPPAIDRRPARSAGERPPVGTAPSNHGQRNHP